MPLSLRNLILAFIVLWLPLQGCMAATMPFCQHHAPDQHAQHRMSPHTQDKQDPPTDHTQHHGKSNVACDHCSLCLLCGALALPSFAAQGFGKTQQLFNIPAQASFSPVFLAQPQRPPSALSL